MLGSLLLAVVPSLAVTLVGALFILRRGERWPLRAEGDGRLIGGLALLVGILVGVIPSFVAISPFLLLGAAIIVLVGLIDDRIDLSPWQKLLGQGVAAALATIGLSSIRSVTLGLTVSLGGGQWVLTFLWTLGMMNAVNLIDGLDGLALAVLVSPLTALTLIASLTGESVVAILAAATLGAVLGFYPFNRHHGHLLLGDTGAGLLGYLLAVLTLTILTRDLKGWSIVPALFLAVVPLSDTVFAVVRRLARGRSIFQGDKQHIHHRLAAYLGVKKAVALLAVISFISSCTAFLLWRAGI